MFGFGNMSSLPSGEWGLEGHHPAWVSPASYQCGFCEREVSSERGWDYLASEADEDGARPYVAWLRICPNCARPTFLELGEIGGRIQYPNVPVGKPVSSLPPNVRELYDEARKSASANAPTASVLALRKLLMNIAVDKGAPEGQSFQQYVEYLASKNYVPPDGKHWVDHIRKRANEANHQIIIMTAGDAEDLITFAEMLLKFIYEFPNRVPKPASKK